MKRPWAYVTLATNDQYGLGAQVLGYSLRETNTTHQLVCLITYDLSPTMKDQLQKVFDRVMYVEELNSFDEERLSLLGRKELGVTFTKLHVWNLVDYERVVFLDADCLVLKSIDELFETLADLDETWIAAAPDIGWPDCFNSGMFVCRPSVRLFQQLLTQSLSQGSFDGGDQGLLNVAFESTWKRVPFVYNTCLGTVYSYAPAYRHYENRVKILHFLGGAENKPWTWKRTREGYLYQHLHAPNDYRELIQKWWSVHDRYVLPLSQGQSGSETSTLVSSSRETSFPAHLVPSKEFLRERYNWQGLFEGDATSRSSDHSRPEEASRRLSKESTVKEDQLSDSPVVISSEQRGSKVRQLASQYEAIHLSSNESSPKLKTRETTKSPSPRLSSSSSSFPPLNKGSK